MSNRLDQEREQRLQPKRKIRALQALNNMDILVEYECQDEIRFMFNGSLIRFFPYSGWHSGKTIKDGRGFNHLFKQLEATK